MAGTHVSPVPACESVTDLIDRYPVSGAQVRTVILIFFALILDGMDLQLLSLVAPTILAEWGVDRAAVAPALSAAVIGMAAGAAIGGRLGDRWGRKTMLLVSVGVFGAATMGTASVDGLVSLTALRLVTGLALGAATPNGLALTSEWLPDRARIRAGSIITICVPGGGMLGAILALWLLPLLGWRGMFRLCGLLTLVLGSALIWWLPESPSFLVRKGRGAKAAATLARFSGVKDAALDQPRSDGDAPSAELRAPTIFIRSNLRINAGVAIAYFSTAFVSYGFVAWTPVILGMAGFSRSDALRGSLFYNILAVVAPLAGAYAFPRYGTRALFVISGAGMIVVTVLLATILSHSGAASMPLVWTTLALIGLGGLASALATAAIFVMMSAGYPEASRGAGIGFGFMAGRGGGFAITLAGGYLLNFGPHQVAPIFIAMAGAAALAMAGSMLVDRHVLPSRRIAALPDYQ